MLKELKNNNGLTLIELLFTLAILGIVTIAVIALLTNAAFINRKSEQQYNATLIAQTYMENIKATENIEIGQTIEIFNDFKILIDVSEVNKYNNMIYKVRVEVLIDEKTLEVFEGYKILRIRGAL